VFGLSPQVMAIKYGGDDMSKEGTKVFNGKRYDFYAPARTKAEAQKEANIQRKQGFYARITYAKPLWFIWLRKSHRGEY